MTVAPRVTHRGWLSQLRDGLTEEQGRAIVAAGIFLVVAVLATLAFGDRGLMGVLGAMIVWLLFDRASLHERCDDTADRQDQTEVRVAAIVDHLTGNDTTSGRHADAAPARYKPSPRPRIEEAA